VGWTSAPQHRILPPPRRLGVYIAPRKTQHAAIVRSAVLWLSVLACLALVTAQVGAYLEFALVPEPTASTTGPQNTADLVFGLMAIAGGVLGFLLTVSAAVVGLIVAATERRNSWVVAIIVSGAVVFVALAVSALILLGLPRNPYHLFTVLLLVPLTTLAFVLRVRQTASHPTAGSPIHS